MNPFVHYIITLKALKNERSALCSFACDIDPAKTALHRKLYFEGGVLDYVHELSLDSDERAGVIAHLIQDAIWDAFFRDQIRGKSIWVHRMYETFWTRSFFAQSELPEIKLEDLIPFLRKFGEVDITIAKEHIKKLYWILTADEKDVLEFYWDLIGEKIIPMMINVDRRWINKFIRITRMLVRPRI